MSVPVHTKYSDAAQKASRATAAYRAAERLGQSSRRRSEWQHLCDADLKRRNFHAFYDFLGESDNDQDEEVTEISGPDSSDQRIRSAYLLSAIAAGSLCLFLGAWIGFS